MNNEQQEEAFSKPYERFEYLYEELLARTIIDEDKTLNTPKNMIIALEKMKFDRFLIDNGISKPNDDGYYTEHDKHYTLNNYIKYNAKMEEIKANNKAYQDYKIKESLEPIDNMKYSTNQHVLSYIFDCNASGKNLQQGLKKEIERIGNKRMGAGKGNRFYKVFNEVITKDLNNLSNLIKIGGDNWRLVILALSTNPEQLEQYLQSKDL